VICLVCVIVNTIVKLQFHEKASFLIGYLLLTFHRGEKRRPSIIRRPCSFDSKIRVFSRRTEYVSAYKERDKIFFRKIEFFHFLPSFFAEKCPVTTQISRFLLRRIK